MGIRQITGYIAHGLLLAYWLWVVSSTAPQLRKGLRGQSVRVRILLIKTAAVAATSLMVGLIHFWATSWWQILAAVPLAVVVAALLHRAYRRVVAAPKHRIALVQRLGGRAPKPHGTGPRSTGPRTAHRASRPQVEDPHPGAA
jgi:membrane protein implicated in regulation of membrane protease activity